VEQAPIELPVFGAEPRERADAQRNRLKVLDAAERLFSDHGVDRVSMDAIAAEAGVGKGTLFRRFGDRAGLARALLEEHTRTLQEAIIRGPAPLGPGAPPRERLKAMGAALMVLLDDHVDLIAAGDAGRPGARFKTGPYAFYRMHVGLLVRQADPAGDWEFVTDTLLGALAADSFVWWRYERGMELERMQAGFDEVVDRLLPEG
jgi:AcrR family transcriptional regulator